MGCDIHAFIEYGRKGGGWETFGWCQMNPGRDYEVFGRLADIRGGTSVIGPPRGVPEDISFKTNVDLRDDGSDAHSKSWCTPDEWEKAITTDDPPAPDYFAMLGAMRELEKRGHQARVVFWFDN